MTIDEFALAVEPQDIKIVVSNFVKKWIGDSVSYIRHNSICIALRNLNISGKV